EALGPLWAQVVDRGRKKAPPPQRAGDCAREQARPHRLGSSPQGARLRVRQGKCDGVPTSLIIAPCSGPSRRGLAAREREARPARRPAFDGPSARGAPACAGGDEGNGGEARTKERLE